MKRRAFAFGICVLLWCVTWGQHGYLGKRNILSIGLHDRLWSDAWSVSYSRSNGQRAVIRADVRYLSAQHDLYDPGSTWLDLGNGESVGSVQGSGIGLGAHLALHPGAGLSAPLGYYISFGLEYFTGTTAEKWNVPPDFPLISLDGLVDAEDINYSHSGIRVVHGWGIRKVLTGNLVVDLGAEISAIMVYKATTDQLDKAPNYRFPFERAGYSGSMVREGAGVYRASLGVTILPMLRVGHLF